MPTTERWSEDHQDRPWEFQNRVFPGAPKKRLWERKNLAWERQNRLWEDQNRSWESQNGPWEWSQDGPTWSQDGLQEGSQDGRPLLP